MRRNWLICFLILGLLLVAGCGSSSSGTDNSQIPPYAIGDDVSFLIKHSEKYIRIQELIAGSGDSNDSQQDKEPVLEPEPEPADDPYSNGIIPVRLRIPAIKLDAVVERVGLLENGQMGVPSDDTKVGWFELGYQPGWKGNAAMAGHIDNKRGPAVFYYLKRLKPGDMVYVEDAEGKELAFTVTDVVQYKTEEAPLEEIFGPSEVPRLNLITCSGKYDPVTTEHSHRLVVFTELVSGESETQSTELVST